MKMLIQPFIPTIVSITSKLISPRFPRNSEADTTEYILLGTTWIVMSLANSNHILHTFVLIVAKELIHKMCTKY